MNIFAVPRRHLSTAFWRAIEDAAQEYLVPRFEKSSDSRVMALEDARRLYSVVKYFAPHTIVEIGAGRSTHALRSAAPHAKIYTCDRDYTPPPHLDVQHSSLESYQMLANLADDFPVDMFVFDARLSLSDRNEIQRLGVSDSTVMVFDDFEGIEKGVHNAMMLLKNDPWLLMTPEQGSKLAVAFKRFTWKPQ